MVYEFESSKCGPTSIAFVRDRLVLTYYVSEPKSDRLSSRFRSLPVGWLYEGTR